MGICSGLCKTILESTLRPFKPIYYAFQPYGYSRSLILVKGCYNNKSLLQGMVFITCTVDEAPMKQQPIQYLFVKYLRFCKKHMWYPSLTKFIMEVDATDGKQNVKNIESFFLGQGEIRWMPTIRREPDTKEKDDCVLPCICFS